jgi:AcrR family transcriptional regulator
VGKRKTKPPNRPYELGKRLEQMDHSRAAILRAARAHLETGGYRQLTMASLAAASGVTRQTVHNLFGTKKAILEALFDVIALDGGMDRMRDAMAQPSPDAMLSLFVEIFCHFWSSDRVLMRRIHGIGAIDPEFGEVIDARKQRRLIAATRIAGRLGQEKIERGQGTNQRAAALAALTSFEFYDVLVESCIDERQAVAIVLDLSRNLFAGASKGA